MLSALSKLGLSGGVGFLIGLAIVSWVEPTTNGGTALLIAISVIVCMTIGGIVSKLFGGNDKAAPKDEQDKAEKQETEGKALPKITSGDSSTEL
jgi:hypothetical protein